MKIQLIDKLGLWFAPAAFLLLIAPVAVGCSTGEPAPTNASNSKYVGGSASDKIGEARAKAHSRLPHGGVPPAGQ